MFVKDQEVEKAKYEINNIQRQLESVTQRADNLTSNLDEIRSNNNKLIMKSNLLNKLITDKDAKIDDLHNQLQNMELKMED